LKAFEDPNHEGNGATYHSGKRCHTKGCKAPAGTWWSPHWCFEHNVARIRGIDASLNSIIQSNKLRNMVDDETRTLRAYCDRLVKERDQAALVVWRPITDADKVHGKEVLLTVGTPYIIRVGAWYDHRVVDRGRDHVRPYVYPAGWYERDYSPMDRAMAPNFVADIPPAPSKPNEA
jgi:hypothetical protein